MLFDPEKLLLIAGPCSLENELVCRRVAERLLALKEEHDALTVVFKGSFDKANRTSLRGPRGTGIDSGLGLLAMVRRDYGLPILTDVHETCQVTEVAGICDILQIPAFLCRQTDLLIKAGESGRIINVKKGQFLSGYEMRYVIEKLEQSGAKEIWQTERGTTFGYNNLIVDMRNFPIMKGYGYPAVIDATHSVQLPGGGQGKSTGQRQFVSCLAKASLAAGADGLFLETHPNPVIAISDGPNQIFLKDLSALIQECLKIWHVVRN